MRNTGRAIVYTRVGSIEQAERDSEEHFRITTQRNACKRKAKQLGLTIVDEYNDLGMSGDDIAREQLQFLLNRISDDDSISHVITYNLSRISRNSLASIKLLNWLEGSGVELVLTNGSVVGDLCAQLYRSTMTLMHQASEGDGVVEDPSEDEEPDDDPPKKGEPWQQQPK
jgi:DNA invertase Pin-like site-specific DNA recombinase